MITRPGPWPGSGRMGNRLDFRNRVRYPDENLPDEEVEEWAEGLSGMLLIVSSRCTVAGPDNHCVLVDTRICKETSTDGASSVGFEDERKPQPEARNAWTSLFACLLISVCWADIGYEMTPRSGRRAGRTNTRTPGWSVTFAERGITPAAAYSVLSQGMTHWRQQCSGK